LWSSLVSAVVEIQFSTPKFHQGSLQKSIWKVDQATAQKLELQKLKGQTVGGVLYIYSVSPLMRKNGSSDFEADAKVIFVKVPETNFLGHKTTTGEAVLTWNNVEVIPVEAPKELLFGTFEVPSRMKILTWASILVGLIFLGLIGFKVLKKLKQKKLLKQQKLSLKNDIQSVNEYQEVVRIWQSKHKLLREFPHLETPFKDLETTLFKYQFKPRQTDFEKNEVMTAWKKFIDETRGGFDGI
jgi:hypothetical protein